MVYKQSENKALKERLKQSNRKVTLLTPQVRKFQKMQEMIRRLLAQAAKDEDKATQELLSLILEEGK